MGEMMTTFFLTTSQENPRNQSTSPHQTPINSTTCPTWKLYENPFYSARVLNPRLRQLDDNQELSQTHNYYNYNSSKQIHSLQLPISARKIAASFWDLTTFVRPFMESELEIARARIMDLKAELQLERKARKKMESLNKKLVKELSEERKGREALGRVCEELAKEISLDKEEISRMKQEMAEERKMLRLAEVLREERVQMKLAEAKLLFEEKLSEFNATNNNDTLKSPKTEVSNQTEAAANTSIYSAEPTLSRSVSVEKLSIFCSDTSSGTFHSFSMPRKVMALSEPENPHIKRGIKGFVEFPKVFKAIGSRTGNLGANKLECQKAQLRIVLKQKNTIRSSSSITS